MLGDVIFVFLLVEVYKFLQANKPPTCKTDSNICARFVGLIY
jgi:hypothetical protein